MSDILALSDVYASYAQITALHGVSLAVRAGGVTAVLGANGAGKTTTLRAICGAVEHRGTILFEGQRIDRLATADVARRGIAYIPDTRGTFSALSVQENLQIGSHRRKDRDRVAQDLDLIYGYFPRLRERRWQQAGMLSGGEQQMLAIGRALIMRPKLLVLDEPSFGLAPLVVAEIFSIMRRINREEGVAILLVEQNARMALELADHAFLLEQGRIAKSGTTSDFLADQSIMQSYLGY